MSEFEKSFNEVQSDLSGWLNTEGTHVNFLLYENYQFFFIDINNIINRIENEAQILESMVKEIPSLIAQKEKDLDILRAYAENWLLFRLDMKSFFIFIQTFIDTLARIIRCTYGIRGKQLHYTMTKLLKNKNATELDEEFFENLRKRMIWYIDFYDKRDSIVHWLGGIRTTTSRKGDFGFDVLKFDINAKN